MTPPSGAYSVRPTVVADISPLGEVLDDTQLFPSAMLPGMVGGYLQGPGDESGDDLWCTCHQDGVPIGFGYAAQEKLAQGTWNFLALAVSPSKQNRGAGTAMLQHVEQVLRSRGQRVLIVETSSSSDYDKTQQFYRRNGFVLEARVREFWGAGEDKLVFW
eukprot:CAMPEP_0198324976 /NCGR_PEP_ID=MMETSP1450-20131203/12852_1 /TAXON_ID=753684 ORGANISM="Madagascaria erythrocladiodes, Strain CCMP3234" /NCGR_SAMPLE_ID=MMETSP1450 /ASSEMBLY_ACC=CAM_ASM_001115 /LENGTH=159 /DNA_ID=CAMNT_0044028817 /DNA_START=65 /DNA_END=541 /DNA_ORIENTATION=+